MRQSAIKLANRHGVGLRLIAVRARLIALGLGLAASACELFAPVGEVNGGDAAPHSGCDALPGFKALTPSSGSNFTMWNAALVKLTRSPKCIYMDETEVTVAEYGAWADANATFSQWDQACAGWKSASPSNPARTPGDTCSPPVQMNQADPFAGDKPIRCIDWCDAEAFCRTERGGGHLCYRNSGGGSVQPENRNDEWPSACSNSGTTVLPWGMNPDESLCNIDQTMRGCGPAAFSCGPDPVRSHPNCRTRNDVFDLIGNVSEWLGICSALAPTSPDGTCFVAGGGYNDSLDAGISCSGIGPGAPRSARRPDLGFRCCYDLSAPERLIAGVP